MKNTSARQGGFTLVELLVVIAIIAILIIVMLPAINAARESARRSTCINHEVQIMLGVNGYEMAYGSFPAGTVAQTGPVASLPIGYDQAWMVRILPYIDEPAAYRRVDFSASVYAPENDEVRRYPVLAYRCPSDADRNREYPISNYAGVNNDVEAPIDEGNSGAFVLNRFLLRDDFADGLSTTLFIGEKLGDFDLGWMSGTRATLRNAGTPLYERPDQAAIDAPPPTAGEAVTAVESAETAGEVDAELAAAGEPVPEDKATGGEELTADAAEPAMRGERLDANEEAAAATKKPPVPPPPLFVGGFCSEHGGGVVIFAYGDGHVQPISTGIDLQVLQQLANRGDGALVSRDDVE